MKDLTFRGHAQRKRYNPIQVPDQTQKILDEGSSVVSGMKDVQAAELRNREAWLEAFKEKNRKEERAATEKFDIEKLSKMALQDPSTATNPKKMNIDDMKVLYEHSISGKLF